MTSHRPQTVAMLCVILVAALHPTFAQQQRLKPESPPPASTPKAKDGFIDFTLKRINPRNEDYGQCITDARQLLVSETVENAYFWSNVAALTLLSCFFSVIVYQRKLGLRRELMNAEALCQFENALARSEAQAETATSRNHELMAVLAAAHEVSPARSSHVRNQVPDQPAQTKTNAPISAAPVPQPNPTDSSTNAAPAQSGPPKKPGTATPQLGLFSPDVDQIATINALQQQLVRCQEKVKNLTRQLNDAERRVQDEQQKNRSLKGQ
jgi:hypothetical protein